MSYNFGKLPVTVVPEQWIYKHYLNLTEPLDGSSVRLYSMFNTEKTPSFYLYFKNGKYRWKDHSSGKSGDAYDLASALFEHTTGAEHSFKTTVKILREEYNHWIRKYGEYKEIPLEEHYHESHVSRASTRPMTFMDYEYWAKFGITQSLLEKYNVLALRQFQLGRMNGEAVRWGPEMKIKFSYGYYDRSGTLLKIYNPFYEPLKHITLEDELLGRDQLGTNKTLIIASSMKDLLTLKALSLGVEVVAPMGEKIIINQEVINDLKEVYPNILTMFDNDKVGIQAMLLYKSLYNIDYAYLPFYKDVSEFRSQTYTATVKQEVTKVINKKITKSILDDNTEKSKGGTEKAGPTLF